VETKVQSKLLNIVEGLSSGRDSPSNTNKERPTGARTVPKQIVIQFEAKDHEPHDTDERHKAAKRLLVNIEEDSPDTEPEDNELAGSQSTKPLSDGGENARQNQNPEPRTETPQLPRTITLEYDRSDLEVRILVTSLKFGDLIYPGFAANYIAFKMKEQRG
jgi:hypothetical protein